ncbi:MAG: hypothetical protein WC026_13315 [Hyphomicrobium sp.]|uniref:hypothetical protein n=1 Tax=Hyphomicrobium sp. TaxID=82 RepID=UPI003568C077
MEMRKIIIAKRDAFVKEVKSGKFDSDKSKIYKLLLEKPMTLENLILYDFPEKTASARISELMDLGLVSAKGNKHSFFHVVKNKKEQTKLMNERQKETFSQWKKRGEKMGWIDKIKNGK